MTGVQTCDLPIYGELRSLGLILHCQVSFEVADVDLKFVSLIDCVRVAQEGDDPHVDQVCAVDAGVALGKDGLDP